MKTKENSRRSRSGITVLNRGAIDGASFSTKDPLYDDKIAGFELFSAEIPLI
jgi:hypothetical protein